MQTTSENKESAETTENVISLFGRKPALSAKKSKEDKGDEKESFADIMRRNAANKERERKDRIKANKGVIRSYRLHKK